MLLIVFNAHYHLLAFHMQYFDTFSVIYVYLIGAIEDETPLLYI